MQGMLAASTHQGSCHEGLVQMEGHGVGSREHGHLGCPEQPGPRRFCRN